MPYPSRSLVPERDVGRMPVLETQHLGIDFGGLTAVDDFTITVGATEICGLIGPNGAGKTTDPPGQPHGHRPDVPEHPPL